MAYGPALPQKSGRLIRTMGGAWERVSDLIDKDTKSWSYIALIKEIFLERDATQILNIPLSSMGLKDGKILAKDGP